MQNRDMRLSHQGIALLLVAESSKIADSGQTFLACGIRCGGYHHARCMAARSMDPWLEEFVKQGLTLWNHNHASSLFHLVCKHASRGLPIFVLRGAIAPALKH